MIHLVVPYVVACLLVGLGVTGIVIRRNAVLVLIGVELVLAGALVLFVTSGVAGASAEGGAPGQAASTASILPLFVMTIAAAEVVVALAVILALFRARGTIDLSAGLPMAPRGSTGPERELGARDRTHGEPGREAR